MLERMDFTSFILPHIVWDRKDSSVLIIKKNTNLDEQTQESIQFLQAVPQALLRSALGTALQNHRLSFIFFCQDYNSVTKRRKEGYLYIEDVIDFSYMEEEEWILLYRRTIP